MFTGWFNCRVKTIHQSYSGNETETSMYVEGYSMVNNNMKEIQSPFLCSFKCQTVCRFNCKEPTKNIKAFSVVSRVIISIYLCIDSCLLSKFKFKFKPNILPAYVNQECQKRECERREKTSLANQRPQKVVQKVLLWALQSQSPVTEEELHLRNIFCSCLLVFQGFSSDYIILSTFYAYCPEILLVCFVRK